MEEEGSCGVKQYGLQNVISIIEFTYQWSEET